MMRPEFTMGHSESSEARSGLRHGEREIARLSR
jgi:hypothetical protein